MSEFGASEFGAYPDRVYALNPAITGFGADKMPVIVAAGRRARAQPHADGVYSAHGGSPSAAVLQYSDQEGIAVITFPNGRFIEESQYKRRAYTTPRFRARRWS